MPGVSKERDEVIKSFADLFATTPGDLINCPPFGSKTRLLTPGDIEGFLGGLGYAEYEVTIPEPSEAFTGFEILIEVRPRAGTIKASRDEMESLSRAIGELLPITTRATVKIRGGEYEDEFEPIRIEEGRVIIG